MCERETTPIFAAVCDELLIEPEKVIREVDEFLIAWHAERMRAHPGEDDGSARGA